MKAFLRFISLSDVVQFFKLEWFEWVMFQDKKAPFPHDMVKLGHHLGFSIDISPAMTIEILMENGQVLPRSTHRPLILAHARDVRSLHSSRDTAALRG